MKFEDILAIVLGILIGWILGFTKFDLPLPVRIHKVNVIDPMNATEIIEKHLWNCNELYLYSVKPLEWFFGKLGSKEWSLFLRVRWQNFEYLQKRK